LTKLAQKKYSSIVNMGGEVTIIENKYF
jgi:hypothetical protein